LCFYNHARFDPNYIKLYFGKLRKKIDEWEENYCFCKRTLDPGIKRQKGGVRPGNDGVFAKTELNVSQSNSPTKHYLTTIDQA